MLKKLKCIDGILLWNQRKLLIDAGLIYSVETDYPNPLLERGTKYWANCPGIAH
jgi:hypothetical protein